MRRPLETMHIDAGELTIELALHEGVASAVEIRSTRPQLADRVLAGRPVDEALALVPRLFSICGRAQGLAAELAVQSARGQDSDAATDAQRLRRLETEIAHEYLWRILLDWPRFLHEEPDAALLAQVRSALDADDRDPVCLAVEGAVFGAPARPWWEHEHVPAFEIWVAEGRTIAARVLAAVQRDGNRHGAPRNEAALPLLSAPPAAAELAAIAAHLQADPQWAQCPELGGRPAETGAPARLKEHPLVAALGRAFGRSSLTRLAARLTELARIVCGAGAGQALFGTQAVGPHGGLGWVETARGLLVHLVQLDGERIGSYRIVAPTEWNFHPRGALYEGLIGAHAADDGEIRTRAHWLAQALDPCVQYRLQVRHA